MVLVQQGASMGHFKSRKPNIDLSRPSVLLTSGGNRSWQVVKVSQLKPGDILAGHGMLHAIDVENYVYLTVGENVSKVFFLDDTVFAFTMKGD